jgi:hypothetical protein
VKFTVRPELPMKRVLPSVIMARSRLHFRFEPHVQLLFAQLMSICPAGKRERKALRFSIEKLTN